MRKHDLLQDILISCYRNLEWSWLPTSARLPTACWFLSIRSRCVWTLSYTRGRRIRSIILYLRPRYKMLVSLLIWIKSKYLFPWANHPPHIKISYCFQHCTIIIILFMVTKITLISSRNWVVLHLIICGKNHLKLTQFYYICRYRKFNPVFNHPIEIFLKLELSHSAKVSQKLFMHLCIQRSPKDKFELVDKCIFGTDKDIFLWIWNA